MEPASLPLPTPSNQKRDLAFQMRSGFPKKDTRTKSYWLQDVQGDPLLNHRTTAEMPSAADIVVIGSGVRMSGTTWIQTG